MHRSKTLSANGYSLEAHNDLTDIEHDTIVALLEA